MINRHRDGQVLAEHKLQTYFPRLPKSDEIPQGSAFDPNRTYRRVKLFTTALDIDFAFRKRLSDCALLAMELEFMVPDITVALKPWVAQELMHCVLGICYALWREQAVRRIYGPNPNGDPNSPTQAPRPGDRKSTRLNSSH